MNTFSILFGKRIDEFKSSRLLTGKLIDYCFRRARNVSVPSADVITGG